MRYSLQQQIKGHRVRPKIPFRGFHKKKNTTWGEGGVLKDVQVYAKGLYRAFTYFLWFEKLQAVTAVAGIDSQTQVSDTAWVVRVRGCLGGWLTDLGIGYRDQVFWVITKV